MPKLPVVNSHNEWDTLEEVVVGVIEGATVPSWHITLQATMPTKQWDFFKQQGGQPFPKERIDAARADLEECVHILEQEGVKVTRPDPIDFLISKKRQPSELSAEAGVMLRRRRQGVVYEANAGRSVD